MHFHCPIGACRNTEPACTTFILYELYLHYVPVLYDQGSRRTYYYAGAAVGAAIIGSQNYQGYWLESEAKVFKVIQSSLKIIFFSRDLYDQRSLLILTYSCSDNVYSKVVAFYKI